jgi:hypothetical protein
MPELHEWSYMTTCYCKRGKTQEKRPSARLFEGSSEYMYYVWNECLKNIISGISGTVARIWTSEQLLIHPWQQESREHSEQRQPCHRAAGASWARPRREEPRILRERRRRRRRRHPGERPRGGPRRPHRAERELRRGRRRQERDAAVVPRGAGGRPQPHGRHQQGCRWPPQGRRHPRLARQSLSFFGCASARCRRRWRVWRP